MDETETLAGPLSQNPDSDQAKTRALARLRQAAWEATQWLDTSEVVAYVDGVMAEVESDAP